MARTIKLIFAVTLLVVAVVVPAFGQSSSQERVEFTISVPFRLAHSSVLLPPGRFVLYQPANDPNLFALCRDDLTRPPIAWITTTRVEYVTEKYPDTTSLITNADEAEGGAAIISGWDVPGEDGWNVMSVYITE